MNLDSPQFERETISRLMDGDENLNEHARIYGPQYENAPIALEAWDTYHLIGDALRTSDLAHTPNNLADKVDHSLLREPAIVTSTAWLYPNAAAPIQKTYVQRFLPALGWAAAAGLAGVFLAPAVFTQNTASSVNLAQTVVPGAVQGTTAPTLNSIAMNTSTLVQTENGVVKRDARLEQYLMAHQNNGAVWNTPIVRAAAGR